MRLSTHERLLPLAYSLHTMVTQERVGTLVEGADEPTLVDKVCTSTSIERAALLKHQRGCVLRSAARSDASAAT